MIETIIAIDIRKALEGAQRTFRLSAEAKQNFASLVSTGQLGEDAIAAIQQTITTGGKIRIWGDNASRWNAHHLNEEFVVRYKAGEAFGGRLDRAAIDSLQYCEFKPESVAKLIRGNFNSRKDTLVVFCSLDPEDRTDLILNAAAETGIKTILVAPQSRNFESTTGIHFCLPSISFPAVQSLQRVVLHAICEGFEPEFSPGTNETLTKAASESAAVDQLILGSAPLLSQIAGANNSILKAVQNGRSIFLCGNGGSTCDANELTESLRALNCSSDYCLDVHDLHAADVLMCAVNDSHPPFARQIVANGKPDDVVIVYSTSGKSQNVIDAVNAANERGLITIGLLGKDGGQLGKICRIPIIVPSNETGRIQEGQAVIAQCLVPTL